MCDSPAPGVDGRNALSQKNGRGDKMHYHKLEYSFGRHGGLGGSDALLNGPDEALNFRDIFLFYERFRFIPRVVISLCSGSNSQSV